MARAISGKMFRIDFLKTLVLMRWEFFEDKSTQL
jgi:hypothetical protein